MGLISLDYIMECVSKSFDVKLNDLTGHSRVSEIFAARAAVYWIANRVGYGTQRIGKHIKRDHSTVHSGIRRCVGLKIKNETYNNTVMAILKHVIEVGSLGQSLDTSGHLDDICRELGVLSHDCLKLQAKIRKVFDERLSAGIRGTLENLSQKTGESQTPGLQGVVKTTERDPPGNHT